MYNVYPEFGVCMVFTKQLRSNLLTTRLQHASLTKMSVYVQY